MRIDLLTSPLCPDCPTARDVVARVAAARPGTAVYEWDITKDAGPAVGRGLFITPAVIVDGDRVVIGVPTESDLLGASESGGGRTMFDSSATAAASGTAEMFAAVEARLGFVPNLIREMGRSPAALRVYLSGQEAMKGASLSEAEQEVVQLAVSVYNECPYCRAAHRVGARMAGVAAGDIEAIEKGDRAEEPRARALASATWQLVDARGWLNPADLSGLESQGIGRAQVYEIVALIGIKTISNYVNHIAHTPIDGALQG